MTNIVTTKKEFVTVGTHLYTQGGQFAVVTERIGDIITINEEGDTTHEWDSTHDLNRLQAGWSFARQDRYIENI